MYICISTDLTAGTITVRCGNSRCGSWDKHRPCAILPPGQHCAQSVFGSLSVARFLRLADCNIDENTVRQIADAFVANGMKAAGYEYINLDDCECLESLRILE